MTRRKMGFADQIGVALRLYRSPTIGKAIACVLVCGGLVCAARPAAAQFIPQGPKLVGNGAAGGAQQGYSVSLSGDGNTLVVGGPYDNTGTGAVWTFTRSGGTWTQLGSKLVGSGAIGFANQGWSVALSADASTLLVGGPDDSSNAGAAWVFTFSVGVWTQQAKLGGSGAVGPAYQGTAVALSDDGNIALVGGPNDNDGAGAAWVFTRSGGVWTQQGSKLIGSNASATARQGAAVALSGDGSTLIIGGNSAWVFAQSGGVWAQQAQIGACGGQAVALSQNGNTAIAGQQPCAFTRSGGVWTEQANLGFSLGVFSTSVALSADGNTAIAGNLDGSTASVLIQKRGVWTKQESPLVDIEDGVLFGFSVGLSADGKTAVVGGTDQAQIGAAWPYALHNPVATHDFNGDGKSDILWQDTSRDLAMWLMNGGSVLQSAGLGTVPANLSIIGQHDFNANGNADLLWRDNAGSLSIWFMNGTSAAAATAVSQVPTNWAVYGTGDINGDFAGDLLWRDSVTGAVAVWFMNGAQVSATGGLGTISTTWSILGDDNNGEIFWRDTAGDVAVWQVTPFLTETSVSLGNVPSNYVVRGLGDFNGGGSTDILWQDTNTGTLSIWFLNGTQVTSTASVGTLPSNWNVAQIGDYNGDGMSDILFLDSAGDLAVWLMNGATVSSSLAIGNVGTTWHVQNTNTN